MRLQGRNTTAIVRLATDLPNIAPVRLQVSPGMTFTLTVREATALAAALVGAVEQLTNQQIKEAADAAQDSSASETTKLWPGINLDPTQLR